MEGAQGQMLEFRESNQIGLKLDSNRVHLTTLNYGSHFFRGADSTRVSTVSEWSVLTVDHCSNFIVPRYTVRDRK